ncbi:acylamino-acid-releasing enzyme isoform X1 [Nasonia vitripennis]|uniref:Acylamino-acid-releasing enzyme n=1 Tax=Nasonia vitripennis TaxID=7425 RepID=A0A7M7Q4P9_NASVI|nr:acylamino-acid-releasing enzyme isoform X1 [Nasonia vitripennis]XP_031781598.1 acylamino-acid-releasing enzyme isoform X1 [Nasonia vitripennis]
MAAQPTADTKQMDKVLDLYKHMSQNPSLKSARIISIARNGISIQSVWEQRNLERNIKQKFTQDFSLDADLQPLVESFPVDVTSELLSTSSENEKLKAILREVAIDGKPKQYIEIWDRQHLVKNYDLAAYDAHGEIYTDNMFSSFQFSPDNTKLMYIAEKKLRKTEPYYKQKPKYKVATQENEEEAERGAEHVYKPDWGEQLEGRHRSVIVLLNIEEDTFFPLPFIPHDYFPAEVIWTPNGECIVGVAYKLYRRYLGRFGCSNRESYIFLLKGTEFRKLTGPGQACKTPQFSPDGKHLIWLERDIGKPHHNVQRLMRIKWDVVETPDMVVDLVKTNITIANDKKFYGFYGQTIPKRCWSNDSQYLFLSTPQRSEIKSYVVNLETKVVTEIENNDGSSLNILDVRKNRVVFTRFSIILPPQLVVGKFDPTSENIGNLHLYNCTKPLDIPNGENLIYEHTEFEYKTKEPVRDFNFTYFGEKSAPEKSMPLLVVPHGGPHYSFCNQFNMDHAIFALLGFGILQINFRGSTGMGGDNIEFLSGRIGETDVLDCVTAINLALDKYPQIDPTKVTLYGLCHGGFLCAHLSGQHSNLFRAVVMRAPIIDIPSMFTSTDIPDWCPANTGCQFLESLPPATSETKYTEIVLKMFDRSPVRHADKVTAPTMIAVGTQDLRSPASQGKLWYNRLIANDVITKLYVYDDNHMLAKDFVEIDFVINAALWLLEHTSDTPIATSKPAVVAEEVPKPGSKKAEE